MILLTDEEKRQLTTGEKTYKDIIKDHNQDVCENNTPLQVGKVTKEEKAILSDRDIEGYEVKTKLRQLNQEYKTLREEYSRLVSDLKENRIARNVMRGERIALQKRKKELKK